MNMTEGEHVLICVIGFARVRIGCKYSAALVYQQCHFVGGGRAYMYACIRICMCMWLLGCVSVAHTQRSALASTQTRAKHVFMSVRNYELISHELPTNFSLTDFSP